MEFTKAKQLRGIIEIPGDKSISHRAIMLGSLANGITRITNFLQGADCLSTIECFKNMGIHIENLGSEVIVHGKGLHGLSEPARMLDVGNSGTTTRLISGILSGQSFNAQLNGDSSIQKRPMGRIIKPLRMMNADIISLNNNDCAPLQINARLLKGIHYDSPVASAQVKSCVLLAGLYADDITSVTEPVLSRNHTELMLSSFGANITSAGTTASIQPEPLLFGQDIPVPGDISSAAFFIAAGLMVPNSEICIKHVGINPTRDGILKVCEQMGANISYENVHTIGGESVADIIVKTSTLHGIQISGDIIPTLIDEIPIIAVLAAYAHGQTIIKDAQELKVKESNRLDIMTENLSRMGVDITATADGMIINGGSPLQGSTIDSHLDHRIAMSFAIASLIADGVTSIKDANCVNISYPMFYQDLQSLQ